MASVPKVQYSGSGRSQKKSNVMLLIVILNWYNVVVTQSQEPRKRKRALSSTGNDTSLNELIDDVNMAY